MHTRMTNGGWRVASGEWCDLVHGLTRSRGHPASWPYGFPVRAPPSAFRVQKNPAGHGAADRPSRDRAARCVALGAGGMRAGKPAMDARSEAPRWFGVPISRGQARIVSRISWWLRSGWSLPIAPSNGWSTPPEPVNLQTFKGVNFVFMTSSDLRHPPPRLPAPPGRRGASEEEATR
jgi:hypothetical protein